MTLCDDDLTAYLDRIGDAGLREPALATLQGIVAAHATSIPFEGIDVLLGRGIRLDTTSLMDKLVACRARRLLLRTQFLVAAGAAGSRLCRRGVRGAGAVWPSGGPGADYRATICCCEWHCRKATSLPMSALAV